jgi:hypothetical protein
MPSEKKNVQYTAIEDLAADLGIIEWDLKQMIAHLSPPIRLDHRGREAVPITCISDLTNSDEYPHALRRAVLAEQQTRSEDAGQKAEALRKRRAELLNTYEPLISEVERLHLKYLSVANQAGPESSGMAVYLLLSRAISTLRMIRDCLALGHWYSGSLLRDVDECLDLAHYFSISKGTAAGEAARLRWFRQNVAPSHSTCRDAISRWQASLFGTEADNHRELMKEVYRKKSRWTHPTYLVIREVASFDVAEMPVLTSVDYGPCAYERKLLELAEFFRSTIWNTFQCLFICFHADLALTDEDILLLREYDRKFERWTDRA